MSTVLEFVSTHWHAVLLGGAGFGVLKWVTGWLDGRGSAFIIAQLEVLKKKSNENSVLAQIAADDAIINIFEMVIPDVLHRLDEHVKADLADGDIDVVDWVKFGASLWASTQEQITGGANDYLKNSSWNDGKKLAEIVAKRFFITQKLSADGLIVDNARIVPTDVTTTTKQTVEAPHDGGVVVTEEVHTEVK